MTHPRTWKRAESEAAAALGGTRDTFAFAKGDVKHDALAVDVKCRKAYSLGEARRDIQTLARENGGKLPLVVHFDLPGRGTKRTPLVILRLSDFREIARVLR